MLDKGGIFEIFVWCSVYIWSRIIQEVGFVMKKGKC